MKHKILKPTLVGISFLSLLGGLFSMRQSITPSKAEEPSWTYESNFPTARTNLSSEWQNGFYGPGEVTYLENGALHISNTTSGIKSVLYKNELDYTNFMVTADAKMTQVSDSGNNAVVGFALSASKKNVTGANHSTQITYIYVAASGSVYLETYFSELNTDFANTTYVPYDAGKQNFTVSWGVSKKTLPAELLSSLKAGNFLNFKMTISGRNVTFSVEDQQMLNFSLDAGMDNYRAFGLMSRGTYTQAAYKNIKILDYTELANRPNLKIGILSDVHIGANASNATYFRQVLQNYKSSKIDLLIVNGDIAHHKEPRAHNQGANAITNQQEFADILNEVFPDDGTRPGLIITTGNHDRYAFEDVVDLEHEHESIATFWENNFGYSVDYGTAGLNCIQKFKGYSFVSVIYDSPVEDRIALLDKAMAEAEPGKPVFFLQHEMPAKTLYITENGNSDDMEIGQYLKKPKYNNVVFIGAHSHNPLTDERAIWQGDFTLFTPCSLFGPSVEGQNYYSNGNEKGSFQPDWNKYKQGIVAKLFDDKMVLERWDYVKKEKLGVDWVVDINDGNIDLSKYNYNNRYQTAVAPVYQSGAKVTVTPLSETMEQISFPSCTYVYEGKDDIVVQYEVEVLKGSEVVQTKHLCSSHYKGRGYENGLTYTVEVGNLKPGIEYTVNVYAMESYKKKSNPLTTTFKTADNTQENIDKPRFDYNVVNDVDEHFSTFSNIGQGFYKRDDYLEGNEYASAKLVSKDKLEGNGAVEAVISIANPHKSLNAGLYVFASDAGKGQDEINAWNIELESAIDSKDLTVNLYRFENLTYKNCPCGTKILNYFDDGASKGNVLVRAIISGNYLTVTIDGNEVFTYKVGSMKDGQVGIRSFYSDSRINALRVFDYHYSPAGNNLGAYLSRARDMLAYKVSENGLDVNDGELWINQATHDYLQEVYDKYSSSEYSYAENKIHEAETALTIALNFVSQSAKFGQKGMFENKKTMLDAYMEKIDILMSYQISTDGQDVYTNMKWINQATYDALKATKEEYSKSEHRVSIESLDNAINKVKEAISAAEATVKQGLKQKEEEKKTTDQTPLVVVGFVVAGVFFIAFVLMLVLFLHSRKPKII